MKKFLTSRVFPGLSIASLTFLVYLPALRNEFVNWDDPQYVYRNAFIRAFDRSFWASAFGFHAYNWHPLTWLSHALDYAVWGLDPFGHHLTNLILHALNTMLVVLLAMKLLETHARVPVARGPRQTPFDRRGLLIAGGATGLLFGLHPVHVESVAWVSERKDLLCALFFLLSIILYADFTEERRAAGREHVLPFYRSGTYLAAAGCFVLALLSKPMAVTLPFVLLLLDSQMQRRTDPRSTRTAVVEKIPLLALSLAASVLTLFAQGSGGAVRTLEEVPVGSRLFMASRSLVLYLMKLAAPWDLVPLYPYPRTASFLSWQFFIPFVLGIAGVVVCIAGLIRRKAWAAAFAYYGLTLAPVLGIIQVGNQSMADRYLYLPSLGPLLLLGAAIARFDSRIAGMKQAAGVRLVSGAGAVIVAASLSALTVQQIGIWKNSIVFWEFVTRREPSVSFARYNLGNAYMAKEQWDKAIQQYQAAVELKPGDAGYHNNLGSAYLSRGLADAAIQEFRTAIGIRPSYPEAQNNLGYAYLMTGDANQAIVHFTASLQDRPNSADTRNNLANAYARKGEANKAIAEYRRALLLAPGDADVHYNLGNLYLAQRELDLAAEQYLTVLRLKPDYDRAHYKLGMLYRSRGMLEDARREFELEVRMHPDNRDARQALKEIRGR